MEKLISDLLTRLGEDPSREGLLKTPSRVAQSLEFLTEGYKKNLDTLINDAVFNENHHDMIVVKDIDFFSL